MSIIVSPKKEDSFPQNWVPETGFYFQQFINGLPIDEYDVDAKLTLTKETTNILGNCPNPNTEEGEFSNTGSVIGYVQSGKTTSFICLSAAALDNGYNFIIVLGGRTKALYSQNIKEFENNFSFAVDQQKAFVFSVDLNANENLRNISYLPLSYLEESEYFSMPLISVHLKHQDHIKQITKALKRRRNLLDKINVLIIDDEADSASLNALVNDDDQTAIYAAIQDLRRTLPRHAFLQYTATPQAILLSARNDKSSPEWARIISPGKKYVGTNTLFSRDSLTAKTIPENEIYGASDVLEELPNSFILALRTYLLTAAQSILSPEKFSKHITMMVHPDLTVDSHRDWGGLISEEIQEWKDDIHLLGRDLFIEEHGSSFNKAYKNLRTSNNKKEINPLNRLIELVPTVISHLKITTLNSDSSNPISANWVSWKSSNFHLVIGGNLLDRGFVVKGLVTTYMPRSKGVGNSDTIQQRGRFYGYKKDHLGFIRTWLSKETLHAFKSYANTEKDLYERLKNFSRQDPPRPLGEWLRTMVLDPQLKPCRSSVISIDLLPNSLNGKGWFWTRKPMRLKENQPVIEEIINHFGSKFQPSFPRKSNNFTPNMKSLMAKKLELKTLLEKLSHLKMDIEDQQAWIVTLVLLGNAVDQGYSAALALMGTESLKLSEFAPSKSTKEYFGSYGEIRQGLSKKHNFPGEEKIISKNEITLQIFKKSLGPNQTPYLLFAIKTPGQKLITEQAGFLDEFSNPFST